MVFTTIPVLEDKRVILLTDSAAARRAPVGENARELTPFAERAVFQTISPFRIRQVHTWPLLVAAATSSPSCDTASVVNSPGPSRCICFSTFPRVTSHTNRFLRPAVTPPGPSAVTTQFVFG